MSFNMSRSLVATEDNVGREEAERKNKANTEKKENFKSSKIFSKKGEKVLLKQGSFFR